MDAFDASRYTKAEDGYGRKGTVIPKHSGVGETGLTFDTAAPYEQNVVIQDHNGTRTVKLDKDALARLRTANSRGGKGPIMSYEEAAKPSAAPVAKLGTRLQNAMNKATVDVPSFQPAGTDEPVTQPVVKPVQGPQTFQGPVESVRRMTDDLMKVARIDPFTSNRKKVVFEGPYGRLTVPYHNVRVDNEDTLVMLQYSTDHCFYEAPMGDSLTKVRVDDEIFMCYPGVQFKLDDAGCLQVTVYLIDIDKTNDARGVA